MKGGDNMSDGLSSPSRENHASAIQSSIRKLTGEIGRLEDLLDEIQGHTQPKEATLDSVNKEPTPSVLEIMTTTSGTIYQLTERLATVKHGIRESLF